MGKNGRRLTIEKYRWRHAAYKTLGIYEQMLQGNKLD
jgi:hypothetical protein